MNLQFNLRISEVKHTIEIYCLLFIVYKALPFDVAGLVIHVHSKWDNNYNFPLVQRNYASIVLGIKGKLKKEISNPTILTTFYNF